MCLNLQTLATCVIVLTALVVGTPIFIKGFKARGTGIYERNFLIQRAPHVIAATNVILIVISFLMYVGIIHIDLGGLEHLMVLTVGKPHGIVALISWLGVLTLLSGMCFMIGGWYCLGEYFSIDSEVLHGQGVRKTGLYKYVMHPIYSGIIQCLVGASLASTSIICVLFALLFSAPSWLRRIKHEEKILLEQLGSDYEEYGKEMKWRRLVPNVFPFGV